ncbi:vancomycin resistance histidine kinase VanS [Ruminococcaceae bacterium OttesenSCG-928-I18]|nr:vancomycin resistance histidine kinase VanS [Ruminococcaceae bacterium OttesenSCG-928-I18]
MKQTEQSKPSPAGVPPVENAPAPSPAFKNPAAPQPAASGPPAAYRAAGQGEAASPRPKPKKLRLMSSQVVQRALVVLLLGAAGMVLLGFATSYILDWSWRMTGIELYRDIFYFFSLHRVTMVIVGSLVGLIACLGWVIRPAFNQYAVFIRDSINVEGGPQPPVVLPKELRPLEEELGRINRDMQLYKYAAKEAEQRKDELVVYLAHDLRTPLTSVLGYLELLSESPDLPPHQREKYTGVALRKAQRMQLLVEELFEVTRFNVSQIELVREPVQAEMLVKQLAEEMQPELSGQGVNIQVENHGLAQLYVDPEKLARALDNILHNALYYSPEVGQITVVLDRPDPQCGRIQISNTGADIPQEKLNRFFEKFYRGDEARQSHSGGSGLGLAIAKNIIEAHGGSIGATSRAGLTTFEICLPL